MRTNTNTTIRFRTNPRGSGAKIGMATAGSDSATYTQKKLFFRHPMASTTAQEVAREMTTSAMKAAAIRPTAKR